MGNELEVANQLRTDAKYRALYGAMCLALALPFYVIYHCIPDQPDRGLLLGLSGVPMGFALNGLVGAWFCFRRAGRARTKTVMDEP